MKSIEMLVYRAGERIRLLSPSVGLFTQPLPRGRALVGGDAAGVLLTLGVARTLIVPRGVDGCVANDAPELVRAPVDRGSLLYELVPRSSGAAVPAGPVESEDPVVGIEFRSPSAGRFWLRSRPQEPPLVEVGAVLADGRALGLIEVMKTMARVLYRSGGGLPTRARVARVLVADGSEVTEGQPLFALEPADDG